MQLSYKQFAAAKGYILAEGRDIEQALFRYHFQHGSKQAVIEVLSKYQGDDGGFMNMGEGDRQLTSSMDTSLAFQILSEIKATSEDEIVQKGIKYLINSFDYTKNCWHPTSSKRERKWDNNPCAELLGYLYEYRQLVPSEFLATVTEVALSSIRKLQQPYDQFYFLSALCIYRLAERIAEPYKSEILNWLKADIFEIIEMDQSKWATTYCAKPFFFAHTPNSLIYVLIKQYVDLSLENEILTQSARGNFILNWHIDNQEDERLWKSIWTMDVLRALHHHRLISSYKEWR